VKNKRVVYSIIAVAVLLFGVIGYRIYSNVQSAKLKAASITKGRITTVEVMPVFTKSITPVLTFTASLEPGWYSDISPKVDGRIAALNTDEGQFVTAGQVVATVENAEFANQASQAEGSLYAVRADLAQARADFDRAAMLFEQGAMSRQQYEAASSKVENLEGQVRSSQGNLGYMQNRLNNADVVTPHSGKVIKRYLQAGDYAKAGTAIFNVADTSVMLAKATVGEGQVTQVKLGDMAQVIIEALSDQPLMGRITKISPAATVPARTFVVEVTLDNTSDTLLSGLTAKVMANGREHPNAVVVPEASLVLFEDQQTVFVLNDDKVVQRKVKVGYVGDGLAEVLSGLNPGDLIVVAGQNAIRDGSKVQVTATREAGSL
jgi:membrane fusion protein, multidrug efflux system